MSNNYAMTCLSGGGSFRYDCPPGHDTRSCDSPDEKQAHQVAAQAASRRTAMVARIQRQLDEDRAEAAEFGEEQISAVATGICIQIATAIIDSLVWHDSLMVSASSTRKGGASLVLTNKDLSKRLSIKIPREGGDPRVIRIGSDNTAVEAQYESKQTSEYVKWFL